MKDEKMAQIEIPGRLTIQGDRYHTREDIDCVELPAQTAEAVALCEKVVQKLFLDSVDEHMSEKEMRSNGAVKELDDERQRFYATHAASDDFQLALSHEDGHTAIMQAITETVLDLNTPEGHEKFELEYEMLYNKHGEGLPYFGLENEREISYGQELPDQTLEEGMEMSMS